MSYARQAVEVILGGVELGAGIDLCVSLGYLLDLDGNPMPAGAGADAGSFEAQ